MSKKTNISQNLKGCCLNNVFSSCSSHISKRFEYWPSSLVNIDQLKDDAVVYLVDIGVISKYNQGSYNISECELLLNRLSRRIDIEKPFLKVCPLHRYTFGFGWKDSMYCAHADHKSVLKDTQRRKRKRDHSINNRVALIHLFGYLVGFPYGGRLCGTHVKQVYSSIQIQQSLADELNTRSDIHSYEIESQKHDELEKVNMLLTSLGQSPLKSQVTMPLDEQTTGAVRRIVAKFRQSVSAYTSNVAHSIAPGQEDRLIEIANLQEVTERRSSVNSKSSSDLIDEQYLQYLVQMYTSCKEKNFPYNEQVRVLTLIPESWKLTSEIIQEKFDCSSHAVKTARSLRKVTDTPLHIELTLPKIRQRIDQKKLDYFLSWMLYSEFLINVPWGSTNLKLENGQVIQIPRQILQAQQSQVIFSYKDHCEIVGIDPLSDSTIYSILNSLNISNQKFVSGIDEFVKAVAEAWLTLEKIIRQLPISYAIINDLLDMIEKNKMYLKTKYGCQCEDTSPSTTHCTIFGLSEPNSPYYSQLCAHDHSIHCADCYEIFFLFDVIENHINSVIDKELKDDLVYDFEMSWSSIVELMAHKLRTAQQEKQKRLYTDRMDDCTAFLTVDWAQKILPQQFREAQSSYYGKAGMSVLVGSFLFKMPLKNEFVTRTYMLALTSCAQTEIDTLSCGQIILKQFNHDFPHITKLIKRSDNASVLGGHYTIHSEKKLADDLGIELLMRDYSEVQAGKSVCDRISGTAKLRLRSYVNSGNDLLSALDIKKGFEYGGGIKNLKTAVAEVINATSDASLEPIPEITSIRNIVYDKDHFIIRKATGVGLGESVDYENFDYSLNVQLVHSFETIGSDQKVSTSVSSKKRTDRETKSFLFCTNESCVCTFESEDELNDHVLVDQHTTADSSLRTNDTVKMMLFEKMKTMNTALIIPQSLATTNPFNSVPRHSKPFLVQGWALRKRKSTKSLDKDVKEYVKLVFEEEKIFGGKISIDEYVSRIRKARNPDLSKRFTTSQYLTYNQVKNQLKALSAKSKLKSDQNGKPISTKQSPSNDRDDHAIQILSELETLRKTITERNF